MLKLSFDSRKKFAAFLLIFFISLLLNYYFLLTKFAKETQKNAEKINLVLSQNFEQVENILIDAGKKIVSGAPNLNLKTIHKIFVQNPEIKTCHVLSWSFLDWVNIDGYQMVNTVVGIRKSPPLVGIKRTYAHQSNKLWKIIFSEADLGVPSGSYIIPVGVQITDKNGSRIGTVSAGIDIKNLSRILKSQLSQDYGFMIIDEKNRKFVFGSENSIKYFEKVFNLTPVKLGNENYIFKKEMEQKFPYEIWAGYNLKAFWLEFTKFSLLIFLGFVGIGFFVFRKK